MFYVLMFALFLAVPLLVVGTYFFMLRRRQRWTRHHPQQISLLAKDRRRVSED
jgi:preprotein translocase subunit YajC